MMRVLSDDDVAERRAADRELFNALSAADKLALANIRYRLRNADDKDAIAHFVRQTVNGIPHDYADEALSPEADEEK